MGPMGDSMAASSQGDDIEPIEGTIPAPRMVLPSSSEAYREPWSEWCAQPSGGRLRAIAILGASSASSAAMRADIHHPTIPLLMCNMKWSE